ncbi:MAG: hypothetical protein ABI615_02140 [Chthoniobacterales bacterium]
MTRARLLAGIVFLCLVWAVTSWISNWGLINIAGKNLKLANVLKTMSRQGGIEIISNLDPETRVSVEFHNTTLTRALEILSARTESNWQGVWVVAPTKSLVAEAMASFKEGKQLEDWKVINSPGMGAFAVQSSIDPRTTTVTFSPMQTKDMASAFDQLAQKSGERFVLPKDWNPDFGKMPSAGRMDKLVSKLAKSGKGVARQAIVLSDFRRNWQQGNRRPQGEAWMGGRGNRANQEWMAERMTLAIANLPPAEQEQAKKEVNERRQFWASLQGLPPEERRKKMEEFFNRRDIQDKMEQLAARRDADRTPEQRVEQYRKYVERKQSKKGS